MADTLQFTKPKDIEIYGSMIAIFARAAKKMGRWASKPTDITIYPINDIVGAGKWNSLNASETDFVINGPTEIAKARTDKSGLFGALPIIHEPQRSLSLQAPTLLGRAGCKLRATIENKTITIPLQDVSFGFLVREGNRPGKIVIRKSIGGFKKGTVLMNGRNWVRKFGESVVDRYDESGMPIKQEGEPDFRYDASYRPIDRDGKPLLDERYKPLKPDGEPLFNIIDSRERLCKKKPRPSCFGAYQRDEV